MSIPARTVYYSLTLTNPNHRPSNYWHAQQDLHILKRPRASWFVPEMDQVKGVVIAVGVQGDVWDRDGRVALTVDCPRVQGGEAYVSAPGFCLASSALPRPGWWKTSPRSTGRSWPWSTYP
jgi:hypothetical protein